jgi:hypothetical protein
MGVDLEGGGSAQWDPKTPPNFEGRGIQPQTLGSRAPRKLKMTENDSRRAASKMTERAEKDNKPIA